MKFPRLNYAHPLDQRIRPSLRARLLLSLLLALLLLPVSGIANSGPVEQPLRIGLIKYLKGASVLDISGATDFTITNETSKKTAMTSTYLEPVSVRVKREGIEVKRADGKSVVVADRLRIALNKPEGLLTISAPNRSFSQYRGALDIRRVSDTALLVVNELPLEDYLKGVLPAEMPPSFQSEALKAQAIAARTYSERYRDRHADSGYDICDSDHCQVYLGSAGEAQRTTRAVLETAGLVIRYNADLIWAVYSADCGGHSQCGEDTAIGQPAPYLQATPDRSAPDKPEFCCVNKTHEWKKIFAPQELETALNVRLKPPVQGLKSLAFCGYDDSGRVKRVDIVDAKGARTLTGVEFRRACGSSVIRSLRMTVSTTEDGKICFEGKGWGHGVGMCQWGAEGLAREPWKFTCDQILKHYYPGITIGKLKP